MWSPRMGSLSRSRPDVRRLAAWAALALGGLLPSTGCQVEYAGMTLPSGKYMHDDVQYFPPGPDFQWANTQAATQRARMQAMGIDPGPAPGSGPMAVPPAAGAIDPAQNRMGRPTDVNASPLSIQPPLGNNPPAGDPSGSPVVTPPPPPPGDGGAVPPPSGF